jgi:chromosome segregation ATPase
MNAINPKPTSSPAELATVLEGVGLQLTEWTQALRRVDEVLRASAETQHMMDETLRRHEHVLAQIAEARGLLADLQAEKLQMQADWEANKKRWEAERHEQLQGFLAERDRLQSEIDGLQKRRTEGEQALGALRAILANVRSHLDGMTE